MLKRILGFIYQNNVSKHCQSSEENPKQGETKKDNFTKNKNGITSNILNKNTSMTWKHLISTLTTRRSDIHIKTSNWKPIAMKIISQCDTSTFEDEFRIYTKLLAFKNESVERYGIPSVWYKGSLLNKFDAIGMTLCSVSIMEKLKKNGGQLDPIDLMVVFYQVVSKLIDLQFFLKFFYLLKSKKLRF